MYSLAPKFLGSFLAYEYSKYAECYADFKSVEIIRKQSTQKMFFAKHFCKLVVYSRREETLNILTVFGYNFFLKQIFHIYLNIFEITVQFCVVLIPIFKFWKEKVCMLYIGTYLKL
jgi:hypothetical protein